MHYVHTISSQTSQEDIECTQGHTVLMYTLRYQAFIANPNNVNDKRIFFGQVRSMDETRRDVIAEQNCFIIGKPTCKNFKNDHDTIDYKIELRNLKEEAKDEDEESGISEEETSLSSGVVSGP